MSTTIVNRTGLLFLFRSSEYVRARVWGKWAFTKRYNNNIATARSSLLMASHEQRKNRHKNGAKHQSKYTIIVVVFSPSVFV